MRSFPWDSIVEYMEDGYPVYDRAYSAREWWDIYSTFFSNGVFENKGAAFRVMSGGSDMKILVYPGAANINGCFCAEESIREFTLARPSSQDRYDTVVLRFDQSTDVRSIDLYVKQGIASNNPAKPELTRSETIYELGLCDIYIKPVPGSNSVPQSNINDTRANSERCGYVTPLLDVDTTTFYTQVNAALEEMRAELDLQTQIAIDAAKDALNGTTAGKLQAQVDSNTSEIRHVREAVDLNKLEIEQEIARAIANLQVQ